MFGYQQAMKAALDDGAPVVWGARTLWKWGERPQLLGDRQGLEFVKGLRDYEEKSLGKAFLKFINENEYFKQAWDKIPYSLRGSSDEHVILIDDEDLLIECNPLASYGYLYIAVSPKSRRFVPGYRQ